MINAAFSNTVENVRKHRDIKLVRTKRRRNYLISDPSYYTKKFFTENVLAIEMKKTQKIMNKPVYLGLLILDIRKIAIYEFWYDYIKWKYSGKSKLCYMDTDSFIAHTKTDDICKDISEDLASRDDTSSYELDRPVPMGKKIKQVVGLMKDELGGQIIKKFVGWRPKTYSYLKDNNDKCKRAKSTKKCVLKRKLKFEYYKNA